jgi:hypothetical protein
MGSIVGELEEIGEGESDGRQANGGSVGSYWHAYSARILHL